MHVDLTVTAPTEVEADVLALVAGGLGVRRLAAAFDGRLVRSAADADPVAVVQVGRELRARRIVLVATDGLDPEDLRTAAARAVRACRGTGTVAWALDDALPMAEERQLQSVVEGAVLGSYDRGRWKSEAGKPAVERFVVCGVADELAGAASRPEIVARWTNVARELVDAPPNVVGPAGLAERAAAIPGLRGAVLDEAAAGPPALAAVGRSSTASPRLIVLRREATEAPARPHIALVGKAVTFDAGGYFLKS